MTGRLKQRQFRHHNIQHPGHNLPDIDKENKDEYDKRINNRNEQAIDHFWCKVFEMETSLGSHEFPTVSLFVKILRMEMLISDCKRANMSYAKKVNRYKVTSPYVSNFDKKREKLLMSTPLLKAECNSSRDYYNLVSKEKSKNSARIHQEEHISLMTILRRKIQHPNKNY